MPDRNFDPEIADPTPEPDRSPRADPRDIVVDQPEPVTPFGSATTGAEAADAVTLIEVAAPDEGGVREAVIAANRSESPPSPAPAKRVGWGHPVARIITYTLIVIALTVVFLVLLINVFRLG